MDIFLLTLNSVLPVFLVMAVGFLCRRANMVSDPVVKGCNKLVFQVFLPLSLMKSLMNSDPALLQNGRGAFLFAMLGTLALAVFGFLTVPRIEKENARRGVMIQGMFRSNYAILGIPLSEALYPQGDGGVAAMMVIATVPLFNVLGVITLEAFRGGSVNWKKILRGVVTNPLLWGCLLGYLIMRLQIPVPQVIESTIGKLASVASPLALFALGATVDVRAIGKNLRAIAITGTVRLLLAPAVFLSLAYALGMRGPEFAALMIAFGSPCAVSSYSMAAQMDGDVELAAQQVMFTTMFSSLTLFGMICLFKAMGVF